ncbi:MAG TPA: efflux RND transporter periplasmic adaptor subunit [Gemmataceae bacterium]|jgi:multidrug resistance efflux pump|nr:efflux RND transporter periplasmic adaptor subunit [Gemmataceae bacterium]
MSWIRHRLSWIAGIVLLLASLLGANWIMHGPKTNREPQKNPPEKPANLATVATGIIDTEFSTYVLVPGTIGEVIEVTVKDGQHVSKDTPLLRLDSKLASLNVQRAQFGVKSAEIKLSQAEDGIKIWESRRQAKKEAIEARRLAKLAADEKLKKAKQLLDNKISDTSSDVRAGTFEIQGLEKAISAEEKELEALEHMKPIHDLNLAKENLADAKAQLESAQLAVDKCVLKAPANGTVVRVSARVGDKFGPNVSLPAFSFRPDGDIIVRAEIDPEFATHVQMGQKATIHDSANSGRVWRGKVTFVADAFLPRRDTANGIPNLMQPQQENVLECRVTLDPGQSPLPFIGQKVRVYLGADR